MTGYYPENKSDCYFETLRLMYQYHIRRTLINFNIIMKQILYIYSFTSQFVITVAKEDLDKYRTTQK